jgi:hypothetical protein
LLAHVTRVGDKLVTREFIGTLIAKTKAATRKPANSGLFGKSQEVSIGGACLDGENAEVDGLMLDWSCLLRVPRRKDRARPATAA